MKFNLEYKEVDDKIASIDKWYDKHTRLWIVQCKNKDGDQVGEAFYGSKKSSEIEYKRLKKEHNL